MREFRTSGSVRGALSNERPYRERCRHNQQVAGEQHGGETMAERLQARATTNEGRGAIG